MSKLNNSKKSPEELILKGSYYLYMIQVSQSRRRASIGLRLAAFTAGIRPNTIPITMEKITHNLLRIRILHLLYIRISTSRWSGANTAFRHSCCCISSGIWYFCVWTNAFVENVNECMLFMGCA